MTEDRKQRTVYKTQIVEIGSRTRRPPRGLDYGAVNMQETGEDSSEQGTWRSV